MRFYRYLSHACLVLALVLGVLSHLPAQAETRPVDQAHKSRQYGAPIYWTKLTQRANVDTTDAVGYTQLDDLDFQVSGSDTYHVRCQFYTGSAAITTGVQLQVSTTATVFDYKYHRWFNDEGASTVTNTPHTTSADDGANSSCAAGNLACSDEIDILLITNAGGNVNFAFQTEIGGSNARIYSGSFCEHHRVLGG